MEKSTKRVRFTENSEIKRPGKPDLVYHEGVEYKLRSDRAQRWIRRGVAVEVKEEQKPAAPEIEVTKLDSTAQSYEGATHGDTVAGASDVSGADSGGAGVGPQYGSGRGRGGSRGRNPGGSH